MGLLLFSELPPKQPQRAKHFAAQRGFAAAEQLATDSARLKLPGDESPFAAIDEAAGDRAKDGKLDDVLEEIPRVRKDLGMLPLVTPTSQIVGTQAVINVLAGERYATISKETAGVLKGEYGATPAPVNGELQARVLEGAEPITCRPADLLEPEVEHQTGELTRIAGEKGIRLADDIIDDVLTYALFPQVGLKFLENREHPEAFEPPPDPAAAAAPVPAATAASGAAVYSVRVNGKSYTVEVAEGGQLTDVKPTAAPAAAPPKARRASDINWQHECPGCRITAFSLIRPARLPHPPGDRI